MAADDIKKDQTVVVCDATLAMPYRGKAHHGWAKSHSTQFVVGVALQDATSGDLVAVDIGMALSKEQREKPLDGAEAQLYRLMFAVEKGQGRSDS